MCFYSWAQKLMAEGRTITTACIHLKNVDQFMKYFAETSPPSCRLTRVQLTGVSRTLKNCLQKMRKDVVLHQIAAKEAKVSRVIPGPTLAKCQDLARRRIPQLLDMMADDGSAHLRHRFYGYLAALVTTLYGHRIGVLINMTVSEVEAAKAEERSESLGFVVNVSCERLAQSTVNAAEHGGELTDSRGSSAGEGAQDEPCLRPGTGVLDPGGVLLG